MTGDAAIIDLADVAAACKPLADWWHDFLATGEPRLADLERARRAVGRLAAIPGPIGRAVRTLDNATPEPDSGALIDAVELLCRIAARPARDRRRRRQPTTPTPPLTRSGGADQLVLPGLE